MTRKRAGLQQASTGERVSRRSPKGRRLLFVAVIAMSGLVCAEAALQLAGLVMRQRASRASSVSGEEPQVTVLCVGDSHTYGLPLAKEDSYPAQLEVALNGRHPEHRFQVVNLGIPGLNSAFVANRLERQLHQLRPDLVIVWAGINNLWNVVERRNEESRDFWLPLRAALMKLRLFRLASIAWFNTTGHQYDPEQRGGWYDEELPPSGRLAPDLDMPDPAPFLARDLSRIVKLTSSLNTPVLFVSYPLKGAEGINRAIEAVGGHLGVGVIDSRALLRQAVADGHAEPDLINYQSGPHPTRLLYSYVVDAMLPVVENTLAAWRGYEWIGDRASGSSEAPPRR